MIDVQTRDVRREMLPSRRFDSAATQPFPTHTPEREAVRVHTRKARQAAAPALRRRTAATGRLAASEGRLFAALVVGTGVVCGLFMIYLGACANVASLGIQQSRDRVDLAKKMQLAETLRADVARAESPANAAHAAAKLQMVLDHHIVCYVNAGPLSAAVPSLNAGSSSDPAAGVPATGSVPGVVRSAMNHDDMSSDSRMASRDTNTSAFKPATVAN